MLRSYVVGAGLSLALLSGSFIYGCSSTTQDTPDDRAEGKVPPARPEGGSPASGSGVVIGVRKLYLGGTDRMGSQNSSAWKDFGYNLDGLVSSKGSANHCQPQAGGKDAVMDDGTEGVDNAFGKELLPLVLTLAMDAQEQVNESLEDGEFSILLNHTNMGNEANQLNVLSKLYAGSGLVDDAIPRWDGTDQWLVAPELLGGAMTDIENTTISFEGSYVNGNTWVSGDLGNIELAIGVAGAQLTLRITRAVITMEMTEGLSGATDGTIAGILETEDLISEIRKVAGGFSSEFCSGSTVDSLLDQLRRASDIPKDGEQSPDKTCDGISIGIGFDGTAVQIGGIGEPSSAGSDPCNEGGAGGEGGAAGGMGGMGGAEGGMGGAGGAMGGMGGAGGNN